MWLSIHVPQSSGIIVIWPKIYSQCRECFLILGLGSNRRRHRDFNHKVVIPFHSSHLPSPYLWFNYEFCYYWSLKCFGGGGQSLPCSNDCKLRCSQRGGGLNQWILKLRHMRQSYDAECLVSKPSIRRPILLRRLVNKQIQEEKMRWFDWRVSLSRLG